ncbi:MAG: hypothetical protein JNM63_18460 [Spirochaetia bacterium]|nr:hypothetical protein [Spirochaetia bacterium]
MPVRFRTSFGPLVALWTALLAAPLEAVPITAYVRENFFNATMRERVDRIVGKDLSAPNLQVVNATNLLSFSEKETSAKKLLSGLYEKEGVPYFLFLDFDRLENGRLSLKLVVYSCREFRSLFNESMVFEREGFYEQFEGVMLEIREKLMPLAEKESPPPVPLRLRKPKNDSDEEAAHLYSG